MHVFCHQTDECFTKDLLSNLSVPMSEKKLMQGEYFETLMQVIQIKKIDFWMKSYLDF